MSFPIKQSVRAKLLAGHGVSYFAWAANLVSFTALYVVCAIPIFSGEALTPSIWLPSLFFGAVLVTLSAIDVQSQRLPNLLTLPLAAIGVILCGYLQWGSMWGRLLAAVTAYLFLFTVASLYERMRGRQGLGLGDAKLLGASGAWLGFSGLPTVIFAGSVAALCCALLASALGYRMSSTTRIPFGPFLAFGTWLVWLYGPLS